MPPPSQAGVIFFLQIKFNLLNKKGCPGNLRKAAFLLYQLNKPYAFFDVDFFAEDFDSSKGLATFFKCQISFT